MREGKRVKRLNIIACIYNTGKKFKMEENNSKFQFHPQKEPNIFDTYIVYYFL